jgi:prohibitin 1
MAVPATVGGLLVSQAIFDVKGGTRAVIFDRLSGVKENVINEGTHFLVPWLQKSIIFDVRTKPRSISTTTGSKDLQMVSLTLRVLHRPNVQALPKIYQVGNDHPLSQPLKGAPGDAESDKVLEPRHRLR